VSSIEYEARMAPIEKICFLVDPRNHREVIERFDRFSFVCERKDPRLEDAMTQPWLALRDALMDLAAASR
jgi:hypothetical protein